MNWFAQLLHNPFLICPLGSWFVAQVLKVIINACIHKNLDWERLVGDGGMLGPFCHRFGSGYDRSFALRPRLL